MNKKQIDSGKLELKKKSEDRMNQLVRGTRSTDEGYFRCLHDGEMLMRKGRWEESGEVLVRSAEIAWKEKNELWLALSHEKLGELAAAQGNWLGALHHYRYARRAAASSLGRAALDRLAVKIDTAQTRLHSSARHQDAAIVSLEREYVSGNMAISFVHRDIFLKSYFARCLECNFCHDWCCSFGADVDIQNVKRIEQQRDEILPFIRLSEVDWFEAQYTYYEEYAGSQYTRINPQGPRCVFISKDQRGCGLHRYAISKGMDYHEIKPLVCILFPLSFEEGVLLLAPELDDRSLICAGVGESAYRALRNELEYYFGRDLIDELDHIESEVLSENANAATQLSVQ